VRFQPSLVDSLVCVLTDAGGGFVRLRDAKQYAAIGFDASGKSQTVARSEDNKFFLDSRAQSMFKFVRLELEQCVP